MIIVINSILRYIIIYHGCNILQPVIICYKILQYAIIYYNILLDFVRSAWTGTSQQWKMRRLRRGWNPKCLGTDAVGLGFRVSDLGFRVFRA